MEDKFDCKDTIWIQKFLREVLLGMEVSMDDEFMYLSMIAYIENVCAKLFPESKGSRPISTPVDRPIELISELLDAEGIKKVLTANGCLG